jgi:hypothetical protein
VRNGLVGLRCWSYGGVCECYMANGEESSAFKIGWGLRQVDPLSPLLFNLVGDVLNKMIRKTAEKGYVTEI